MEEGEREERGELYQLHGVRDLDTASRHWLDHDPHIFEKS